MSQFFVSGGQSTGTCRSSKNLPAMQETPVWFLGQKICWKRDKLPTPLFLGLPGGSAGKKESALNVGDLGSIPGLGRSFGEGNSYPCQYSGLGQKVCRVGIAFIYIYIYMCVCVCVCGERKPFFPWINSDYLGKKCKRKYIFSFSMKKHSLLLNIALNLIPGISHVY